MSVDFHAPEIRPPHSTMSIRSLCFMLIMPHRCGVKLSRLHVSSTRYPRSPSPSYIYKAVSGPMGRQKTYWWSVLSSSTPYFLFPFFCADQPHGVRSMQSLFAMRCAEQRQQIASCAIGLPTVRRTGGVLSAAGLPTCLTARLRRFGICSHHKDNTQLILCTTCTCR